VFLLIQKILGRVPLEGDRQHQCRLAHVWLYRHTDVWCTGAVISAV
jgi:hypothetical protein